MPAIYVKHIELPNRYPALARQAQLHGTVILKLRIAADGKVLTATASSDDPTLKEHPLLQDVSSELVKKWTFGCFDCTDGEYEHTISFVYKLEGNPQNYDGTKVILDLPAQVTITAKPPVCDHCPTPAKPSDHASAKSKGKVYSIP